MSALIEINNLSVTFAPPGGTRVEAVKNLSLSIASGQMVALVGESGSGKSVTGLSLSKLLPKSAEIAGEILWEGAPLPESEAGMMRLRGRAMGSIFQEPMTALNPLHPIGKQIAEPMLIHGTTPKKEIPARIESLLYEVGLHHLTDRLDAYPHQLSGGERQRVMIAMAMACDPKLLIADEPTTALDVTLQRQVMELIKRLQKERGFSVLLITHDMGVVRDYTDAVAVMQRGEIVERGETSALLHAPKHAYTQKLLSVLGSHTAPAPLADTVPTLLHTRDLSVQVPAGRKGMFKKAYKTILEPFNAEIKQGEALGIVGESGSGKTTAALAMLRLMASLGEVWLKDTPLHTLSKSELRPLRADMQMVFQDPYASLNPRLTLGQSILEGLEVHAPDMPEEEKQSRLEKVLSEVGLDASFANRFAHELSGGQRQRIGVARALILEPKLMVLDEPTSALDLSTQDQVLSLLEGLQKKKGLSYIMITHDWRAVRRLCHRVVVLKSGVVVEHGPTEALIERPLNAYTKTLIEAAYL